MKGTTYSAGDFPGSSVVKTQHFQCRGCGFNPWSGKLGCHKPNSMVKKKKKKFFNYKKTKQLLSRQASENQASNLRPSASEDT